MWDGRFRSLEQQVFGPFGSGEMGGSIEHAAWVAKFDLQYVSLFRTVFDSWPTPDGMARAHLPHTNVNLYSVSRWTAAS